MDKLQRRFEELFRAVASHDRIEVLSSSHDFFPYDSAQIDKLADMLVEHYSIRVPEQIREIVNFPFEISLVWKYKNSEDLELVGEFHLENVINAISRTRNRVQVYNEDLDERTKSLMRQACYFDTQPNKGWDTATVFVPHKERNLPELWLLDDLKMFRLDLDLGAYFEALLLTKGMYYWQYLFCDKSAYEMTPYYKKRYIAKIIDTLCVLFPKEDYSGIIERFEYLVS